MKSTILNLKKRVLVVEFPRICDYEVFKHGIYFQLENGDRDFIDGKFDLICGGSELSEEIAEELVEDSKYMNYDGESGYVDYKVYPDGLIIGALDSFISAIEANGFTWGNPIQNPDKDQSKYRDRCGDFYLGKYQEDYKKWQEAESKTFHPEQVILFEILL